MARNKQNNHSAIRFFKIITSTSIGAGKLRIPKSFTRSYGGDMSNPMFLKPQDGTEWKIYLNKIDGHIWFQNGWEEFATYYSLDHGHIVLFEYKGASHFGVHIFSKSALEIDYPLQWNQDKQNNLVQIDDDSVEILDETPPCKKPKLKSPILCPKPLRTLKTSTVGKSSRDAAGGTTKLTSRIIRDDALNRARTLRSNNPSFTAVMKLHYLDVPNHFIKTYFKCQGQTIMLRYKKKLWPVKFICYPEAGSGKLSKGWTQFARESKLVVGGPCVFELNNREVPMVLNVRIGH